MVPWHSDARLLASLPLRYRAYAAYSRLLSSHENRRVAGGSALLRLLRGISSMFGLDPVIPIRATADDTLVVDFSDDRILEVLYEIRRENAEYRVMTALLKPGDAFIDVGANYGTFSIIASRIVGDEGRVIAIEPQAELASCIRESLRLSGIANVEVIESGAGREPGTVTLLVPTNDTGRAGTKSGFSATGPHSRIEVPIVRIDDLLPRLRERPGILMKLDVEGSELDVLSGAEQLITLHRPVILIELNPWSARAAGSSVDDLIERLQSLGFEDFSLARDFPLRLRADQIPRDRQENLVARVAGAA